MTSRRKQLGKRAGQALYGIADGISSIATGRQHRGATAHDTVFRYKKVSLRRYRESPSQRRCQTPIIFIPPFMVRPHVYDLDRGHSFVATLLAQGFDVYGMDFGEPSKE